MTKTVDLRREDLEVAWLRFATGMFAARRRMTLRSAVRNPLIVTAFDCVWPVLWNGPVQSPQDQPIARTADHEEGSRCMFRGARLFPSSEQSPEVHQTCGGHVGGGLHASAGNFGDRSGLRCLVRPVRWTATAQIQLVAQTHFLGFLRVPEPVQTQRTDRVYPSVEARVPRTQTKGAFPLSKTGDRKNRPPVAADLAIVAARMAIRVTSAKDVLG